MALLLFQMHGNALTTGGDLGHIYIWEMGIREMSNKVICLVFTHYSRLIGNGLIYMGNIIVFKNSTFFYSGKF